MWKKFNRAGQAADDNMAHAADYNMAHAHCMVDNYGYKYTFSEYVCNTYCFSTTAVVAQICLNVNVIRTLAVLLIP